MRESQPAGSGRECLLKVGSSIGSIASPGTCWRCSISGPLPPPPLPPPRTCQICTWTSYPSDARVPWSLESLVAEWVCNFSVARPESVVRSGERRCFPSRADFRLSRGQWGPVAKPQRFGRWFVYLALVSHRSAHHSFLFTVSRNSISTVFVESDIPTFCDTRK